MGCPVAGPAIRPGLPDYQRPAVIPLPGALLNLAGASLMIVRSDLELDTRLGRQRVGRIWSTADRAWRWSDELEYREGLLVDDSGAEYDLSGLADGAAVPGSHWVRVSGVAVKTRGGLLHEFDPVHGRLLRLRWTSSAFPRLEWEYRDDGAGPRPWRLVQWETATRSQELIHYEHDAAGRRTRVTDHAGRESRYTYDAAGALVEARSAADVEAGRSGERYGVSNGWIRRVESADGILYRLKIVQGRPVRWRVGETDPAAHGFAWSAAEEGTSRLRYTDPTGAVWSYRVDEAGRLLEREDPTGALERSEWEGLRPVRHTDAAGVETRFRYVDDDLVERTDPSGNRLRFHYAPDAVQREAPESRPLARLEDDLGPVELRRYDGAGRLVERENGAGDLFRVVYGDDEMVDHIELPDGSALSFYGRGVHGRATTLGAFGRHHPLDFDSVGNRLAGGDLSPDLASDQGGVRRVRYDAARRVTELEMLKQDQLLDRGDPLPLHLIHRADGQIASILRPYGGDAHFAYDEHGHLRERVERSDEIWQATRFESDALGRRTGFERPNGMREEWAYDGAGRLVRHAILRDGAVEAVETRRYEEGRLVALSDSTRGGEELVGYDAAGRPAIWRAPDGRSRWVEYDLRSRIVTELYVDWDGAVLARVGRQYDLADREVALRVDGRTEVERVYQGGQLVETRTANGLSRWVDRDEKGRLRAQFTVNAAGHLIEDEYFESFGGLSCVAVSCTSIHVRSEAMALQGVGLRAETALIGGLDSSDEYSGRRLVAGNEMPDAGPNFHAYDHLSNRAWVSLWCLGDAPRHEAVFNPEHNRMMALIASEGCPRPSHVYRWDEAGYAVERDGEPLVWDGAGRIRAIGDWARYDWDVQGAPLRRVVAGEERRFAFGGVLESDAHDRPVALELDVLRVSLGGEGGRLYRHFDYRGNVRMLTDEDGGILRHTVYGAYDALEHFGPGSDDVRDFAMGVRTGGLVVLGHRVYEPHAAAFLAPDPIYHPINQYSYTLGNPIWFSDPTGRQARPRGTSLPTAWGLAFGGAAIGGAVIGSTGGPLGSALGSILALAIVNIIYQHVTGEQGIGPRELLEFVNPAVEPRSSRSPRLRRPPLQSPRSFQGLRARPGASSGVSKAEAAPRLGPIGGCGLGPELIVLAGGLLRARHRRGGRRGPPGEERAA